MTKECPAPGCGRVFKSESGLTRHWHAVHDVEFGKLSDVRCGWQPKSCKAACPVTDAETHVPITVDHEEALRVAMDGIDEMKYQFFQTDAQVQRAKDLVSKVIRALKPSITQAIAPYIDDEVQVEDLIDPILDVVDKIKTPKLEALKRRMYEQMRQLPRLQVYPRKLCNRKGLTSAATSRAALRKGRDDEAIVWETKIEEVLEREFAYDPELVADVMQADLEWTKKSRSRSGAMDPDRLICDVSDGQIWAEHPFLGDPYYDGPTRMAFSGYCDDVDIPNPVGPSAGDHKLFLSYIILLNRSPGDRLRLASVNLASVCLASDTKLVGPDILISGPLNEGYESTSIGANFRRLDRGVTLRTPPECGLTELRVRGWLIAWAADGMAAGAVCGTNSSFSKAKNICNLCEDARQDDKKINHKPCGFLCCSCPRGADVHRMGCLCHFRLRTPTRDATRKREGCSAQQLQNLGITTEMHGFVRIPHMHVAQVGPKDVMHVFLEGVTRHFAAQMLYMMHHEGWASTSEVRCSTRPISCLRPFLIPTWCDLYSQIQHAVVVFDYGNGVSGFDRPSYIPSQIYTKTKVVLADGREIWGPHKSAKLPYSAYGMLIFLVHSIEVLRRFLPVDAMAHSWWASWVKHVHVMNQLLKFEYRVKDLLKLEKDIVEWQTLFFSVPQFYDCWIPKHHWALHAAHDIWRWGPPRFLWCMIYEMKNAHFKRGCKRSNFHNPAKAIAQFYVDYSAYHLKKRKRSYGSVSSTDAEILHEGDSMSLT